MTTNMAPGILDHRRALLIAVYVATMACFAREPSVRELIDLLTDPHAWLAFVTLSALEIVLGIDNVGLHLDPCLAHG